MAPLAAMPVLMRATDDLKLFAYFPKLPPEIRLMIWRCAQPSRLVQLRYILLRCSPTDRKYTVAVSQPSRHVVAANKESRYATMRAGPIIQPFRSLGTKFTFNPSRDIFCTGVMNDETCPSPMMLGWLDLLKDMSMAGYAVRSLAIYDHQIKTEKQMQLDAFMQLHELIVIVGNAKSSSRVKLLQPAINVLQGNRWWGRGRKEVRDARAEKLKVLMEKLTKLADDTKRSIPVVKALVLSRRDLKAPQISW